MKVTIRHLSRSLSFLLAGSLAFSPVSTTFSQNLFRRTKTAVGGVMKDIASAASKKIQSGLSGAFNKVRGLDRKVVIEQLEKQVRNLGDNIGYMANCMFKGTCSSTERATFIGTSLLVLALTAATVGVTLTVAATSKEVDSVVAATSQEVTGWSPQDIFTRLTNTINNFKNSLASLKEGIIKRQLTPGQKKFLYGSALSIAALVTIVMGISIASYVYAQKKTAKEAERKRLEEEQAALLAEEERALMMIGLEEEPVTKEKGTGEEIIFDTQLEADTPKTAFQKFFRDKFILAKDKATQLNKAITETVNRGKNKFFKSKEAASNFFLEKVGLGNLKSDLADFSIKDMVKKLLDIDLGTFFEGIRQVAAEVATTKNKLRDALAATKSVKQIEAGFDDLKNFIDEVVENRIKPLQEAMKTKKAKFATALALTFKKAKEVKETSTIREIKNKLVQALNIYPELVDIVNNKLNLSLIGRMLEKIINATVGGALTVAILTNRAAGKLGGVITSQQMVPLLEALKGHVASLAAHINEALSQKIFLVEQPSTKKTLIALIKNAAAHGLSTAKGLKEEMKPILAQVEKIEPLIEPIKKKLDAYIKESSDAIEKIKMAAGEATQPKTMLKGIPRFPRILRDSVESVAGKTKRTLLDVLKDTTHLLTELKINEIAGDAFAAFDLINKLLHVKVEGEKTSIINPAFIDEIRKILLFDYININENIKKMNDIIRKEPVPAAAGAA